MGRMQMGKDPDCDATLITTAAITGFDSIGHLPLLEPLPIKFLPAHIDF